MSDVDRWVRRSMHLAWQGRPTTLGGVATRQRQAHARAITIVRAFYGLNLLWIIIEAGSWPRLRESDALHAAWPASWIPVDSPRPGITIVVVAVGVTSLWAAVAPQQRLARIAFAVALLEYMAVVNGFGKIVHNLHAMLYMSWALILLPRRAWERDDPTVATRQLFLTVVWAAQSFVLFAYGMTGLWKVVYGVRDLILPDRGSLLEVEGFSVLLANRLNATDQVTLLGNELVDLPVLGWLLFLGTMYVETGSLLVIARPRLHRLWGFGLIGFHIGTQLTMGFTFTQNIAILVLFFVLSPQTVEPTPWRDVVGDLPGVLEARWVLRRLTSRRAAPPAPAAAPARADLTDQA